jgi:hypothetical protein
MIRMNGKAIGLGASAGMFWGTLAAFAFLLLIPEVGFSYWQLAAMPSLFVWSIFMGFLPGALLGAVFGGAAAAFDLQLRSRTARAAFVFCVTIATVALTQALLPVAWPLPRLRIALLVAVLTFISANLSLRFVLNRIR